MEVKTMSQEDERTYPVGYRVELLEPPATATEVRDMDLGACDALVVNSLLYLPEGVSQKIITLDGRTEKELSAADKWIVWSAWAYVLSQDETLSHGKRDLARMVHEMIKAAVVGASESIESVMEPIYKDTEEIKKS
jgi:hypothetical protein